MNDDVGLLIATAIRAARGDDEDALREALVMLLTVNQQNLWAELTKALSGSGQPTRKLLDKDVAAKIRKAGPAGPASLAEAMPGISYTDALTLMVLAAAEGAEHV